MAVKWIGDVAKELGMDVFDAVELLASKQNYPMNGLLDEERVQFLKLYRGERRPELQTAPIQAVKDPTARIEEKPEKPPERPDRTEKHDRKGADRGRGAEKVEGTSVTAAIQQTQQPAANPTSTAVSPRVSVNDKAEERTVIIPPPLPQP